MRRQCQLERISDKHGLAIINRRGVRVMLKGGEKLVIFSECAESLPVMAYSIVAVIRC